MKTDRYTKLVLTVIALCLTVLAGDKVYNAMIPVAHAANTVNCKVGGNVFKTYQCMPVIIGSR